MVWYFVAPLIVMLEAASAEWVEAKRPNDVITSRKVAASEEATLRELLLNIVVFLSFLRRRTLDGERKMDDIHVKMRAFIRVFCTTIQTNNPLFS